MFSALGEWLSNLHFDAWSIVGFVGMGMFASRFIVQWIATERKRESVIPISFWYLSLFGSLIALVYALRRQDPVFILSYLFNGVIYIRNLYFIYKKKNETQAAD